MDNEREAQKRTCTMADEKGCPPRALAGQVDAVENLTIAILDMLGPTTNVPLPEVAHEQSAWEFLNYIAQAERRLQTVGDMLTVVLNVLAEARNRVAN